MERPPSRTFGDVLDMVFARNAEAGEGPTSLRALAIELARADDGADQEVTHRRIESWRRNLRKYKNGDRGYTVETLRRIADAAHAQVEEFPPPASMRERVERLEQELQLIRELLARRPGTS